MDDAGTLGTSFVIIALLLVCSAFFSGTEVAMFGLRRVDREQMARSGRRSHQLILSLLAKPRALITAILIGNESINVSMSAVTAGAVPLLFPGRSEAELALLATGLALPLLLFLGEITPKTIAFKHPMRWASAVVRPLWLFRLLVTPLRLVVGGVAALILRPLGGAGPRAAPRALSEAEFKALVDAGSREGQVDARERRLIHKVFEFGDKTVAEAMIPRDRLFALSYDLPLARLTQEVAARSFSRVPIYQKSLDNVRGVLHAKDLLTHSQAELRRLSQILHEPLFVPQTTPLERLFLLFKQRKIHMALVVNEYGKLAGLVTMDDLLEQLFGEIRDERELRRVPAMPGASGAPEEGSPT
ncbi:MAG TPA: hemolysin family protein [Kofleriaceae bacterium]|nr:hemolysin family protein [Kofleriaceae bacterium]